MDCSVIRGTHPPLLSRHGLTLESISHTLILPGRTSLVDSHGGPAALQLEKFLYFGSVGNIAKRATISFLLYVCHSVCLSVRPYRTIRLPLDGVSLKFEDFTKICRGNSSFIKI
jgi:hypothetical protein